MGVIDLQQVLVWLRRLATLDTRVFDEVRSNAGATITGALVAIVACLLAGIGGWLWWMAQDLPESGDIFLHSAVIGGLLAAALWAVWVGISYIMLTQVFRERAYLEQLMRVMGFATAPIALMLFMVVPGISLGIGILALMLTFGLSNIAIQSASSANAGRIVAANAVGFLVWVCALSLFAATDATTLQPHAPGVFLYNTTTDIFVDFVDQARDLDNIVQD